jgi:hypothetical protein
VIRVFLVVCCCTVAALPAAEQIIRDEVIIVAESPIPPVSAGDASRLQQPGGEWVAQHRGDIYAPVWNHPEQTFVDSEIGAMPLWTEAVYDEHGNPRPRFPDVFTKNFIDNPNEATALAYLENQRVRARRYLLASEVMQRTAVDFGFVTPEAFRPPKSELTNNRALNPPYNYSAENWGVPVLDPQQARLVGLKPEDIPETPGRTTTRYVEVLYFWDHRCKFSLRGYRDFAQFGTDVFNRELGPRIATVSLDNDAVETKTQLDFLEWNLSPGGISTKYIENWLDQTELAKKMSIRVTPTYVFLDRRSGKIQRFEGLKTLKFLQGALLDLVGHKDDEWSQANAEWFRPVSPAAGAERGASIPAVEGDLPAEATAVQAPSRTIKAWDPDGQADR